MQVYYLAYYSPLKMETARFSEKAVGFKQILKGSDDGV
jgi:hypothetical protein